jgi:hypothetical protein
MIFNNLIDVVTAVKVMIGAIAKLAKKCFVGV